MLNNRFLIFFIFSILYSQEFDPETGNLIEKKFDPKTGELVEPTKTINKGEIKLRNSKKIIEIEKNEVEENRASHKANQIKSIKESYNAEIDFNKIYSEETMYMKAGFWSSGYEKNGKKLSKKRVYKELEKFTESRNLYDQARLRSIYSVFGCGLFVISPVLGASTDNFTIFFAAYIGGMFTFVYNTISYSNLINKAVWIFNREALKANSNLKLK